LLTTLGLFNVCYLNLFCAVTVPFSLEERVICVQGRVNGMGPHTFIVDTGASETVITPPTAKRCEIQTKPSIHGQDLGRADIGIEGAVVNDMKVFIFDPPQAVSLRLEHGIDYHGLIGYSFLSNFVTTIDYEKKTIQFESFDERSSIPSETSLSEGFEIPFEIVDHQIMIKGMLNGRGATLLFDTGASETVVTRHFAGRLGLKSNRMARPSNASFSKLNSLSMGKLTLKKLPVIIYDPPHAVSYGLNFDMIIGYSILSQFRITIDYRQKLLRLVPSNSFSLELVRP
jgi:predicted aspartyl protease